MSRNYVPERNYNEGHTIRYSYHDTDEKDIAPEPSEAGAFIDNPEVTPVLNLTNNVGTVNNVEVTPSAVNTEVYVVRRFLEDAGVLQRRDVLMKVAAIGG